MDITLQPENAEFIDEAIRGGEFSDRTDAVNRAIEFLRRQRRELIRDVEHGIGQLDRGESIVLRNDDELDAFMRDLKERWRERSARGNASA